MVPLQQETRASHAVAESNTWQAVQEKQTKNCVNSVQLNLKLNDYRRKRRTRRITADVDDVPDDIVARPAVTSRDVVTLRCLPRDRLLPREWKGHAGAFHYAFRNAS